MRRIIIFLLACICQLGFSQKTDSELKLKTFEIENVQPPKRSKLKANENAFYAANRLLAEAKTAEEKSEAFDDLKILAFSGSGQAMQMIGNYYKYGIIVDQNISEAFKYYNQAIKMGFNKAYYSRGYMYYKGLGCSQDYSKAANDFKICASEGNASCMYMLGLCYRNGFGLEKNQAIGNDWLKKASTTGNFAASREVSFKTPEINNQVLDILKQEKSAKLIEVIENPEVNEFNKVYDLNKMVVGKQFNGFWLTYDYSFEHIVDIKELQISFRGKESSGNNSIEIAGDSYSFDYKLNGDELQIFNLSIDRKDRYIVSNDDSLKVHSFEFQSMQTDNTILLSGIVDAYSSLEKEPGRLAEIIVSKPIEIQEVASDITPLISVSPNPSFINQTANIEFEIRKKDNYKITVTDLKGATYFTKESELDIGYYSFPLELELLQGAYVVTISSESLVNSTKLLKI